MHCDSFEKLEQIFRTLKKKYNINNKISWYELRKHIHREIGIDKRTYKKYKDIMKEQKMIKAKGKNFFVLLDYDDEGSFFAEFPERPKLSEMKDTDDPYPNEERVSQALPKEDNRSDEEKQADMMIEGQKEGRRKRKLYLY